MTVCVLFYDYSLSGAWPFEVGGLTCQVNFGNERDDNVQIELFNQYFVDLMYQNW